MKEQLTTNSTKTEPNIEKYDAHFISAHPKPNINEPPPTPSPNFYPPINCCNNTMSMISCDKWGNLSDVKVLGMMKYSTYTWGVVPALQSAPLPPARYQPHPLTPSTQTINQEGTRNPENRSNSQHIVSYCFRLHRKNQGLREVDLEPSPRKVLTR